MNRYGSSAWIGFGVWAVAAVAHATGDRVLLRFHAPDECPDDAQLVHQVETLLGQSLLETREQKLTVQVSAQGSGERGYAGKLSFRGPQGTEERFFEHPSCEKLVEAMAWVVALAIDPERVRNRQSEQQSSVPASSVVQELPSPKTEEVQPLPLQPEAPRREPEIDHQGSPGARPLHGLRLALHGTAGAGPLPGFGGGAEAALGWQSERFRLELLGRYWVPRQAAIAVTPAANLELGLATLGARACWLRPTNAWRFSACGGADWGSLQGRGIGVENSRSRDAPFAQVAGALQVAYTRSRLVPEGGLELAGALLRPPFGVLQNGAQSEVFRPAAWSFCAFFGFGFEP